MSEATDERRAWLLRRRQGIGGSDAPALTGDSPFRSPLDVWLDKRGLLPLDDHAGREGVDEPQYWGKVLEPALFDRFERDTGLYATGRQEEIISAEHPFMRATIDSWVVESPIDPATDLGLPYNRKALGILELKTASRRAWTWKDGPPPDVLIQVQHNLAVTETERAWIAALLTSPVMHFKLFEIERDQRTINALIKIEERFWRRVLDDDPPPASAGDADSLRASYGEAEAGTTVELPDDMAAVLKRIVEAQMAAAKAEDVEEENKAIVMALMRERETATLNGRVVATWKQHEKHSVDLKALERDHPKVFKALQRTSTYRQFRLIPQSEEEEDDGDRR